MGYLSFGLGCSTLACSTQPSIKPEVWLTDLLKAILGGTGAEQEGIMEKVSFSLYTSKQNRWDFSLGEDLKDLLINDFNPKLPTKLLAHGYKDNGSHFCAGFIEGNCLILSGNY